MKKPTKNPNPVMAHFGRLGGKAGAATLTPEQRKERASRAARARWSKPKGKP